jgi:hypothetical protein
MTQFFIYREFSHLTDLPFENETISENFNKHQSQYNAQLKKIDNYSNFLIDFSLALNATLVIYLFFGFFFKDQYIEFFLD